MQLPYQPIILTLQPGESRQLTGAFTYFLFYDASDTTSVRVRFGSTTQGMAGSFFAAVKGFKNGPLTNVDVLEIKNVGAGPNTITCFIGAANFEYTRDTIIGSLTIADGGDAATGARADAVAGSDTGTFSLIALFKRLLSRVTGLFELKGRRVAGQTASMTGTADVAVLAAPAAGFHLVITSVLAYCTHATVGTEIAIKSGATELFRVNVKPGGAESPVLVPIPQGLVCASATALNVANITSGSATRVAAFGITEAD